MGLEYTGDGSFIPNIPARDITDKEIKERVLSVKDIIKTGLYKEHKPNADNKAATGPKENKGG